MVYKKKILYLLSVNKDKKKSNFCDSKENIFKKKVKKNYFKNKVLFEPLLVMYDDRLSDLQNTLF